MLQDVGIGFLFLNLKNVAIPYLLVCNAHRVFDKVKQTKMYLILLCAPRFFYRQEIKVLKKMSRNYD